ncbi:MAG: hypothetical protein NVS2B2_34690 [Ktedonobacteraceae bacterium]
MVEPTLICYVCGFSLPRDSRKSTENLNLTAETIAYSDFWLYDVDIERRIGYN